MSVAVAVAVAVAVIYRTYTKLLRIRRTQQFSGTGDYKFCGKNQESYAIPFINCCNLMFKTKRVATFYN